MSGGPPPYVEDVPQGLRAGKFVTTGLHSPLEWLSGPYVLKTEGVLMTPRNLCAEEWMSPFPHDPQHLPWKWGRGVVCAAAMLWAPALCSSSLGLWLWIVSYSPRPLQRKCWVPELPNEKNCIITELLPLGDRGMEQILCLDPPYKV